MDVAAPRKQYAGAASRCVAARQGPVFLSGAGQETPVVSLKRRARPAMDHGPAARGGRDFPSDTHVRRAGLSDLEDLDVR